MSSFLETDITSGATNMATPDLLDFDLLLNPISAESPSGENLKDGNGHIFDEIKATRKQGSRGLIDDGTEEVPPNWLLIIEIATSALATRSKDLQVAGWLTEALISQHGFAGCRDGFKLLNELLERFWDTVYPQVPEDGDLEFRIGQLVFCTDATSGGRFPNLLRGSPLVPQKDKIVLSWNYWQSSFQLTPIGKNESGDAFEARKQRAEDQKKIYQEGMQAASRDSIQKLCDDLQGALAEVNRFGDIVQKRFDRNAPGVSKLLEALEDCTDIAGRALKEKGGADSLVEGAADGSPAGTQTVGAAGGGISGGPIRSRQEAFNRLEEIATYLRQMEPHSPVSYLVQRAVNWGRMPFEDLLQELLKDTGVRAQVGELLGIKPPEG